jgi:hypothetical protein
MSTDRHYERATGKRNDGRYRTTRRRERKNPAQLHSASVPTQAKFENFRDTRRGFTSNRLGDPSELMELAS